MFKDIRGELASEKTLWVYVLRRAIYDYVLYRGQGDHELEWKTACSYIFGEQFLDMPELPDEEELLLEGCPEDVFSLTFEEVCGLFGWDPDDVRRITRRMTRDQIKKFESDQLHDLLDNHQVQIVSLTPIWSGTGSSAPSLTPLNYSRDYIDQLRLQSLVVEAPPSSYESMSLCLFPAWSL